MPCALAFLCPIEAQMRPLFVHKWGQDQCYAWTGRSSRREVSLSGVGSGLSALATCNADMW